jgi:hypothetical protein
MFMERNETAAMHSRRKTLMHAVLGPFRLRFMKVVCVCPYVTKNQHRSAAFVLVLALDHLVLNMVLPVKKSRF